MIEYERKFVLRCSSDLISILDGNPNVVKKEITQIYLDPKGVNRLRKIKTSITISYTHTFKQTLGNEGVFELEHDITSEEWVVGQRASEGNPRLEKIRYSFGEAAGQHWDIDFFINEVGKIYFALAEVEFTRGEEIVVPGFLSRYIVYSVPHDDNVKWSSVKLSDEKYALEMFDSVNKSASPESFVTAFMEIFSIDNSIR